MIKRTIGRKERISIQAWGLRNVSAKVDTGAYTSSIHCEFAETSEIDGVQVLSFKVLRPTDKKYTGKTITTKRFTQKKIRNSFGDEEIRYMVSTHINLFDHQVPVEFTLTDRTKMKYPILIGRKPLHGRYLVDVDAIDLSVHWEREHRGKV